MHVQNLFDLKPSLNELQTSWTEFEHKFDGSFSSPRNTYLLVFFTGSYFGPEISFFFITNVFLFYIQVRFPSVGQLR